MNWMNEQQLSEAAERYLNGASAKTIGLALGFDTRTVLRRLRGMGEFRFVPARAGRRALSGELDDHVYNLLRIEFGIDFAEHLDASASLLCGVRLSC